MVNELRLLPRQTFGIVSNNGLGGEFMNARLKAGLIDLQPKESNSREYDPAVFIE